MQAAIGTPTVVAGGLGVLTGIAVDAEGIYLTGWSTNAQSGVVMRVDKSGGALSTLASAQAAPYGIAIDEASIYWINVGAGFPTGAVMRVAKGGGDPVVLVSAQAALGGVIAVRADCVYWANTSPIESGAAAIVTVAK